MCGIFGVISDKKTTIDGCLKRLRHRGPDDRGIYCHNQVSLGFQRLKIIDLSVRGHQPMSNEKQNIWIIFNGEIYNFLALRKQLDKKYRFKSKTDTEVLLHGYEEWGIDGLLQRINGMYAFAVYDQAKNKVYLIRDRIGKKPLYYFQGKKIFAFSSEFKAFFGLNDFSFHINEDSFRLWMGFPYLMDNTNTLIRDVYKIPPGYYLTYDCGNNSLHLRKYWQLSYDESEKIDNFNEACGKLEPLLLNAVRTRLVADVPLGILLSGGLDSSLVTAMAAKLSNKKIKTINIAFNNSCIDESEYAQQVADYVGTEHIQLKLETKDYYDELRTKIAIYDDLSTVDSGLFSEYIIAKEVRKNGIKVVLTGEGADEIFAGYTWFQLAQPPLVLLPNIVKSFLYHYAIMRTTLNHYYWKYPLIMNKVLNNFEGDYLKKMQQIEITHSLPNHYCMKVDKGTAAASVEARCPYMDYKIAELALRFGKKLLIGSNRVDLSSGVEKYILRKIAEKYLPKTIFSRRKKGGMMPVYDMLRIGLARDQQMILNNNHLVSFFGKTDLRRLIKNPGGNVVQRWQFEWIGWKALLFTLWYNHFAQDGKEN